MCKPLAKSTVRKILFLISGAYQSAIVWGWLHYNPVADVRIPAALPPDPQPPTAEEAARVMNAAWRVPGYLGPLVRLAMTTGARRGELCGLRWKHLQARHHAPGHHDCTTAGCEWWLSIRASRAESQSGEYDKDTKTHQTRRVASTGLCHSSRPLSPSATSGWSPSWASTPPSRCCATTPRRAAHRRRPDQSQASSPRRSPPDIISVIRCTSMIGSYTARPSVRLTLLNIVGCGVLTAAKILGETADIRRFHSRDAYARHNGTAPLPVWSSNRSRHRLSRTGNRQLNAALHRIALTQARCHPEARALLARRRASGDGSLEALRVLKRHLSDVVYRALPNDTAITQPLPA